MSERKEKFTPGPWDYIFRDGCTVIDVANRDRIAVVDLTMGVGNVDSNAHLIAAAPELYYENKRATKKLRDIKTFLEANPDTEWMTAHWDGTECDGSALLIEVNEQIQDLERIAAKARGEA